MKVTWYDYDPTQALTQCYMLGLPTNSLLVTTPIRIKYEERQINHSPRSKSKGRPLGSKNRKPRNSVSQNRAQGGKVNSVAPKPRGRFNIFRRGTDFVLEPFPRVFAPDTFQGTIAPVSRTTFSLAPLRIQTILTVLQSYFKGRHITSNTIERLFSRLDLWFQPRGRRTPTVVARELTLHLTYASWLQKLNPWVKSLGKHFSTWPSIQHYLTASKLTTFGQPNLNYDLKVQRSGF